VGHSVCADAEVSAHTVDGLRFDREVCADLGVTPCALGLHCTGAT
jgi:hypothetical protein